MANRLLLTSIGSPRSEAGKLPKLTPSIMKHTLRESVSSRTYNETAKTKRTPSRIFSVGAEKLEVENLDEWNTQHDSHYKELESEFKRLYKTIESENAVHSKFMERMQISKDAPKRRPVTNLFLKTTDLKSQVSSSRQSREFEERLQNEYEELDRKIEEMKETVKQESTRVCDLRASLHELHSSRSHTNSVFEKEESTIKGMRLQNLASYLVKKSSIANRRTSTDTTYSKMIATLQMQAEEALELVEAKRMEIEACKNKIRAIRIALIKHFSQILKEGKDCRTQGLRWVVAQLAKYDVKVTESSFPEYLDAQSSQVIMTLAEKAKEVEHLNEFLHSQYRGVANSERTSIAGPLNDIKTRLIKVRSDNITRQKTTVKLDRRTKQVQILKELVKDNDYEDARSLTRVRNDWARIQSAEERLESLRAQIEEIQLAEVRRIAHDYFLNARNEIDRHLFISAIVGTESVSRYLNLLRKDERESQNLLEKIKTFSFTKT